jgi:hypothetical protein
MDLGLPAVPVVLPRSDVSMHCFQIGNSPIHTLPVQRGNRFAFVLAIFVKVSNSCRSCAVDVTW